MRLPRRLESRLQKIARRKKLAILLVGLAPLLLRALLLPWLTEPNPRVQDEFSHLLVADTFAHGKLVNPAHPLWRHFESMHILVRPVYVSAFPVAPGAAMAAGQALTGHPWAGVWLSMGFMCASLCWMLQGWVPPGWALLGGALAAARFGVFGYWMNGYRGGALAAAGGALVLGALPRLLRRPKWRDAAVMGAGLAILANSRPYEGLLFALPLLAALVWLVRGRGHGFAILLPLALVVGVTAAAMSYYCFRVTGNPLRLPYSFYRSTYTMAPHFIWQSPRPEPVYLNGVLRDFYTSWEMGCYADAVANRAPHGIRDKAVSYWRFYLGPLLTLPFVALPWMWKRRRTRWLLLGAALFAAGLAIEVWDAPHYAAPAMGLALLLAIEALRHLRQGAGAWVVRAVVLGCILTPVMGGGGTIDDGSARARIVKQLESTDGRHLVLVRYQRGHDVGNEWVYNSADIDGSRIVWAREMDPASNRELLRYFQGRRVWLAQPDAAPVALSPYDASLPPDPPFRFVRLGTQDIAALRSPLEIKQKIRSKVTAEYPPPALFSCDHWNYFFQELTGVEGPDVSKGCYPTGQRGQLMGLDEWFAWIEKQK